jgi:hypothetical protein
MMVVRASTKNTIDEKSAHQDILSAHMRSGFSSGAFSPVNIVIDKVRVPPARMKIALANESARRRTSS